MDEHDGAVLEPSREESLVEAARQRRGHPLDRRQLAAKAAPAAAFLAAASGFALVADTRRPVQAAALVLVLAFALLSRLELEAGSGSAVPTQLAFVPMLFVLPLHAVPLAVCAGYLLGAAADALTGRLRPSRCLGVVGCSWFSLPPAVVLQLAGERPPAWGDWPLYLLAFASQCGADLAHTAVHERVAHGIGPRALAGTLARVYALDALLAPLGLLAARDGPFAFLALLPLVVLLDLLSRERRRRFDALLRAARMETLAMTDPLTGLPNRRAFDEQLAGELERLRGLGGGLLAVCLLDLDHFKEFNDRHGHPAGDLLLRETAGRWQATLRRGALLARLGGEEFALLLPRAGEEEAARAVERLRGATPADITCSAGLACWDGTESGGELVARADRALYAAKTQGRAQLTLA